MQPPILLANPTMPLASLKQSLVQLEISVFSAVSSSVYALIVPAILFAMCRMSECLQCFWS